MARKTNLVRYLPKALQEIKEYIAIGDVCGTGLDDCFVDIENLLKDQFIIDATESGLMRWEEILSIQPKDTDSTDDRRFRILTRLNGRLPYTFERLKELLTTLCGDDYTAEVQHGNYKLIVRVALDDKEQYSEVEKLLNQQVPANMIIDLSLLYNTHEILSNFTHAQLSNYTHTQLREEIFT